MKRTSMIMAACVTVLLMLPLLLVSCDKSTSSPPKNKTDSTSCQHQWVSATCTVPKTCTICASVEGDALGHSWTDATCTAPKTCSICSSSEGDALGHSWTDATCTAPKTCSICSSSEGDALGHSWTDATCTTPRTCSNCDKTEGDIAEHAYVDGICSMCNSEDPVSIQIKKGQDIYQKLNYVNYIVSKQASDIYDAWYFSIYEADDRNYLLSPEAAVADFASSVGMSTNAITEAIDQYLLNVLGVDDFSGISRLTVLRMNSGAIQTVLIAYANTGIYETLDNYLSESKALLKEMDSKYDDKTYFSILKEYYTDTLSYYDFVSAPSGSFSQLSTTLNGYTSKIENHMNDLSFIYED